jgi:transcriptional regulator with XRE-family HTH domain
MDSRKLQTTIASQLHALMNRSGKRLSQAELSRQSGVPQPTISRILKGDGGMQLETLWVLARTLGVTLNDLVYSGNPGPAAQPGTSRESKPSEPTLTALQQSVVDSFNKLVSARQISDGECIAVLSQWAERLDASES